MDKLDPIQRDMASYRTCALACVVALASVVVIGLMALNKNAEQARKPVWREGCYIWSDGTQQCYRGTMQGQ